MTCFLQMLLLSNFLFFGVAMAAEGNAIRGKVVADIRCGPCHHLDSNYKKVGPGLAAIYGKKPSISGVPFDVWDDAALQAWLINPRQIKANTRMVLPAISERDRNDIIAWFKASTLKQ